ncbi:MAG: four helix bundle protein [Ignavibacteriae bacterium]|nr:MAG: four helix bundle protein [Ignavibacteriota bacterium]
MSKIENFEDLGIWQEASDIAVDIYKIAKTGELRKDLSLRSQLQRAVLSISNNIAEGFEYNNNREFIKYLKYAKGSAGETRSMVNFMLKAKHISETEHKLLYDRLFQLSKQIKGFMGYLDNFESGKKIKSK